MLLCPQVSAAATAAEPVPDWLRVWALHLKEKVLDEASSPAATALVPVEAGCQYVADQLVPLLLTVTCSSEDLRTPDVTAPLGATGQEVMALSHLQGGEACATAAAADAAAATETLVTGMNGMQMLQQQQQDGLQHLLRQVEQRLQLDDSAQQQQQQLHPAQLQHQLMQPDQLLLAQAQQQQQQQMDDVVLAQQQLVMANAAGSNQGMGSAMVGTSGFAAGSLQQRGGAVAGMQQQLLMMQDAAAAHRGESFTSQCSTSSYVTNVGALRALSGSLPVSPLIDRSAHSFTLTDRSNAGSFTTLGAVPERPHSFTVGDRPQAAALLASLGGERPPSFSLGERPSSLTLMDGTSRPGSFTLGPAQPCAAPFLVERSASFTGIVERSAASFSGMDVSGGLAVVERTSHTQRSFTYGQRPQLQDVQQGMAWYESDASGRGLLPSLAGAGPPADSNAAVFQQLVAANRAAAQLGEAQQQQQQAGGRLSALWNWR